MTCWKIDDITLGYEGPICIYFTPKGETVISDHRNYCDLLQSQRAKIKS